MDSKAPVLPRPGSVLANRAKATGTRSETGGGSVDLPAIDDYYAWANRQADDLRTGRFELLDLPNVVDEIAALGRSELHTFRSNLFVALTHMLQWDYREPKRSRSWANSSGEHRDRIEINLSDSPTLTHKTDEIVAAACRLARRNAGRETRLPLDTFPETCPYTWRQIMETPYESDGT